MLKTRITEFFCTDRPIVQGGLMWIARAELASALEDGEVDKGVMSTGQCMGLKKNIPGCKELLDRIMLDAEKIINDKFSQVIKEVR